MENSVPGSRGTAGTTARRTITANTTTAVENAAAATASSGGETVMPTAIKRMPAAMTAVTAAAARPARVGGCPPSSVATIRPVRPTTSGSANPA